MLRTRLIQTAGVCVGAFALTTMVSSSAWAGSEVTLHDKATGRCLDSNTAGSTYALACSGNNWQNWFTGTNGGGGYYFEDAQTGMCLTTGTQANSTLIYMKTVSPCADNAVNFTVVVNSDGTNTFKTGTWCLDSDTNGEGNNVGAVYIDPCNGGNYQKFTY